MPTFMRLFFTVSLALLIVACGKNEPANKTTLQHIPADTAFLATNLAPLDEATLKNMSLSDLDQVRQLQAEQIRDMAKDIKHDANLKDFAEGLEFIADYLKSHTYKQTIEQSGMDEKGLYAFYALGLSPVLRGDIDDADKFDQWIGQFAEAFNSQFENAHIDDVTYQQAAVANGAIKLVVATHDKQFIIALLPNDDKDRLRMALGLDTPEQSLTDTDRAKKLIKKQAYDKHFIAYIDVNKLPKLVAGKQDTMLQALAKVTDEQDPFQPLRGENCQAELTRISARVPFISTGYTHISDDKLTSQLDMTLAGDIVDAFKDAGQAIPGMGKVDTDAQFDMAFALPVNAIRKFAEAQAKAINDNPFTCPALTDINDLAKQSPLALLRLGVPPISYITGGRLVVDATDLAEDKNTNDALSDIKDKLKLRTLIGLKDPQSVIDMAKAMIPGFNQIDLDNDGTVKPIPDELSAVADSAQQGWMVASKKALGLSVGEGEDQLLGKLINADTSDDGELAHLFFTGAFYQQFIDVAGKASADHLSQENQKQLDMTKQSIDHLKNLSVHVGMRDEGLRTTISMQKK